MKCYHILLKFSCTDDIILSEKDITKLLSNRSVWLQDSNMYIINENNVGRYIDNLIKSLTAALNISSRTIHSSHRVLSGSRLLIRVVDEYNSFDKYNITIDMIGLKLKDLIEELTMILMNEDRHDEHIYAALTAERHLIGVSQTPCEGLFLDMDKTIHKLRMKHVFDERSLIPPLRTEYSGEGVEYKRLKDRYYETARGQN